MKQQLILQMASESKDVADVAVRTIKARGWLYDGSLRGANLTNANLEGAFLSKADLAGAKLQRVKLADAFLDKSNLQAADLLDADLERTILFGADLRGAVGWSVKQLNSARFLVGSTMPDGIRLRVSEEQARRAGVTPNVDGPSFEEWAASQARRQHVTGWQALEAELRAVLRVDEEE